MLSKLPYRRKLGRTEPVSVDGLGVGGEALSSPVERAREEGGKEEAGHQRVQSRAGRRHPAPRAADGETAWATDLVRQVFFQHRNPLAPQCRHLEDVAKEGLVWIIVGVGPRAASR